MIDYLILVSTTTYVLIACGLTILGLIGIASVKTEVHVRRWARAIGLPIVVGLLFAGQYQAYRKVEGDLSEARGVVETHVLYGCRAWFRPAYVKELNLAIGPGVPLQETDGIVVDFYLPVDPTQRIETAFNVEAELENSETVIKEIGVPLVKGVRTFLELPVAMTTEN